MNQMKRMGLQMMKQGVGMQKNTYAQKGDHIEITTNGGEPQKFDVGAGQQAIVDRGVGDGATCDMIPEWSADGAVLDQQITCGKNKPFQKIRRYLEKGELVVEYETHT